MRDVLVAKHLLQYDFQQTAGQFTMLKPVQKSYEGFQARSAQTLFLLASYCSIMYNTLRSLCTANARGLE